MAKVHYIIESRKKAHIEKAMVGKKRIIIEDIVSVKENNQILLDYGKFINSSKNPAKTSIIDIFTIIAYLTAIIVLVLFLTMLAISKDFNILNSIYIDNIIGIIALLFAICFVPKVKEVLVRVLVGPTLLNKLWYIVVILCLPFCISLFMQGSGLAMGISNICGVVGIVISILTW